MEKLGLTIKMTVSRRWMMLVLRFTAANRPLHRLHRLHRPSPPFQHHPHNPALQYPPTPSILPPFTSPSSSSAPSSPSANNPTYVPGQSPSPSNPLFPPKSTIRCIPHSRYFINTAWLWELRYYKSRKKDLNQIIKIVLLVVLPPGVILINGLVVQSTVTSPP